MNRLVSFRTVVVAALAAVAVLAAFAVQANAQGGMINVEITGPEQAKRDKIVLAPPLGSGLPPEAQRLAEALEKNIRIIPFLEVVPGQAVLGGDKPDGFQKDQIDFKRYQNVGAQYLLTQGWTSSRAVEIRIFDVFSGNMVVGKSYDVSPQAVFGAADDFCAGFMEKKVESGDLFRSTLAFVRPGGQNVKNLWIARPQGRDERQITNLPGTVMSPSWSPDGRSIVFTFLDNRHHQIGLWDRAGGVKTQRLAGTNMVIAPTFVGGRIAVAVASERGDPEIAVFNKNFQKEGVIVRSQGIEVSPRFDRAGKRMVFVSDRAGGPQIFMADVGGGGQTRVTYEGGYNSEPSINPQGTEIVFSRRTSDGFHIFWKDLQSGQERQLTTGPGNDLSPAFCPDSFSVAFTSNRGGGQKIHLTTKMSHPPVELPLGGGAFPAWGLTEQ